MPTSENIETFDVAIIGLGPVGSALANILGQYDISTVILDKEAAAYHLPRAVAFDDEIMRVFQTLGLSAQMEEITEVGGGVMFVDGDGRTFVDWSRPQVLSPNNWYVNYRFHQPDLENVLRQGMTRFPCITARWGCEVTGLDQEEDGVTLRYRDVATGTDKELRTAYVVGCDGARSFTRDCMTAPVEDLGFREPWLVVDLVMKEPEAVMARESYHYCEPERAATSVFLGAKRKRWEFRLNPGDDPKEIAKPENVWRLLERWIGPDRADLERATVYTFHSTIAESWRDGRLFIAGDAAHQTPPFMGQGMCAGIRDAANLGWKLERVLKQGAPDVLLESYQSERRPHVYAFIDLTVQMGQLINRTTAAIVAGNATHPEDGPQKLVQLKPTLGPGLSAGDTASTGHLFPQPRLSSGELLDDRIGSGPALILTPEFRKSLSTAIENIIGAEGMTVIDDTSPELQEWFAAAGTKCALLRPDRYVLGTANSESELGDLLQW